MATLAVSVPSGITNVSFPAAGCGLEHRIGEDHRLDCATCSLAAADIHGWPPAPQVAEPTRVVRGEPVAGTPLDNDPRVAAGAMVGVLARAVDSLADGFGASRHEALALAVPGWLDQVREALKDRKETRKNQRRIPA